MDDCTRSGFLARSMLPVYKQRVRQALSVVRRALKATNGWHVALSGGKDSTVVYDLVRTFNPDAPAIWSDDEYYLPETIQYINGLIEDGANVHHIRTNAQHRDWFTVSGDWNGIDDYAKANGWSGGVFLGLRKQENNYRRAHLNSFGTLFYSEKDQLWHCNPIADWKTEDVWAYIVSRRLKYNLAYDKLAEIGVDLEHQRIGPFATERATEMGALAVLRRGWPDEYLRFVNNHPEGRNFI